MGKRNKNQENPKKNHSFHMHLNKGQTKKKWQLKYLTKIPFTKAIWYREVIFHSNEQLITEQSFP